MSFQLDGKVLEKWSNHPIRGATITMGGRVASTNIRGEYTLRAVPVGRYQASVIHREYEPYFQVWSFTKAGIYAAPVIVMTPIVQALRR